MNGNISEMTIEKYNAGAKNMVLPVFVIANLLRFTPVFLLSMGWYLISEEILKSWIMGLIAVTAILQLVGIIFKFLFKKQVVENKEEYTKEKVEKLIKNNYSIDTKSWIFLFFLTNMAWTGIVYEFGGMGVAILALFSYVLTLKNNMEDANLMKAEFLKQYAKKQDEQK